jgi:hypothetical protein
MSKETATELDLGMDHQFIFDIRTEDEDTSVNISGWTISYQIKRHESDADAAALLVKTTTLGGIAIAGTFNTDPDVNSQRATVTIADTDTDAIAPGLAFYELKRTDAGFETRLAFGDVDLIQVLHKS